MLVIVLVNIYTPLEIMNGVTAISYRVILYFNSMLTHIEMKLIINLNS